MTEHLNHKASINSSLEYGCNVNDQNKNIKKKNH